MLIIYKFLLFKDETNQFKSIYERDHQKLLKTGKRDHFDKQTQVRKKIWQSLQESYFQNPFKVNWNPYAVPGVPHCDYHLCDFDLL